MTFENNESMNTSPEGFDSELEIPTETELTEASLESFDIDNLLAKALDELDRTKPLPHNKVIVPQELASNTEYVGPVYGYIREDSGYHVIIGWEDNLPIPELKTEYIGYVGELEFDCSTPFLHGKHTENGIEFSLVQRREDGTADETPLKTDIYTTQQDIFSRNSGLLETDWMTDKCAVICGCGSVGSLIALQLARSGVGRFVLVDTDCVEAHNICRHQCSLADAGRYKVNAIAERILQINPKAQIKKFYQRIQDVISDQYAEWITPEKAIFIGTCDNRVGDAIACNIAYSFGAPFAALGFMTRAWAGEIFVCLPERHDICYGCAFKTQIDASIEEERRNHFYVGEEELEKAHFEPGLDVDLEYGISMFNKLVLDIINRHNENYHPRILPTMTQYRVFRGTADDTYSNDFWEKCLPTPLASQNMNFSPKCRRCEHCLEGVEAN